MFDTILVPTDGSSLSDKAILAAVTFAQKTGAKLVAISVAEPYPHAPYADTPEASAYEDKMREQARTYVKKIADAAAEAGISSCATHVALSATPYEEIVNAVEKFKCDAIFMASHGRKGLNKLFLGSETQKVLAHVTIPVMVIR